VRALDMSDFNSGDLVRLKSGGPIMTVVDVSEDDGVLVVNVTWFDEALRAQHGKYQRPTLELVDPSAVPSSSNPQPTTIVD
jgi:uncharacterized protein YodC (DUF2158 family)